MSFRVFNMNSMRYNRLRFSFIVFIVFLMINPRYKFHYEYYLKRNMTLCNRSMIESDRFLCESDEKWETRREFYSKQHEKNIITMNEYDNYLFKNWFPEFQCQNEIRLGEGDGGKWVRLSDYLK